MEAEYDFTDAVRGKHHRAYRRGYTVTVHHADGATTVERVVPEPGTIVSESEAYDDEEHRSGGSIGG